MSGADDEAERFDWDSFFADRAAVRRTRPLHAASALQANCRYEVFMGPDRANYREREPSFATIEQAIKWAKGFCDGAVWRVRDTETGAPVYDSQNE